MINKSISLVSVLIGVNRDDGSLKESIKSITSQTYKNLQIIIVNDGSCKNVSNIINSFNDSRIDLIESAKIGLTKALNLGLKNAKGHYIARHDAGDFSLKNRIAKQVSFLSNNPSIAMCGTFVSELSIDGIELGIIKYPLKNDLIKKKIILQNTFCHGSVMIVKKVITSLKGYREKFYASQDYDLWLRLIEKYSVENIDLPLYQRIISPDSISFKNKDTQKRFADYALECFFARKRNLSEPDMPKNILKEQSLSFAPNSKKDYDYNFYCGRKLYASGEMSKSREFFLKSLSLRNTNIVKIIFIFLTILPKNLRNFLGKIWFMIKEKKKININ